MIALTIDECGQDRPSSAGDSTTGGTYEMQRVVDPFGRAATHAAIVPQANSDVGKSDVAIRKPPRLRSDRVGRDASRVQLQGSCNRFRAMVPARSHTWATRLAPMIAAALLAAGCGGDEPSAEAAADRQHRIVIATTVAPITSIVSSIVGDRADVRGIVPEGTNSHTFEPRPSVAELLEQADVVYLNGLALEEPTKRLAEANVADGAEIVELGRLTIDERDYIYDFSFPESGGKPNPHLWTDPTLARRYAEIVKDDMSRRDPDNAEYYAANYATFSAIIDDFDAAMRTAFATVPTRELLTYHDAYAYFAETYGWTVIGAIQVSDFEEPTPREVTSLIEQVRARGVPAIFGSEVFPSPVLEQIGEAAGAEYVDVLRDDDLPGEPGDPEHSWLGLMRFDFVTITEALGGDATALERFLVRAPVPDAAEYPQ